jgi:hypothetical protein
MSEYVRSQNLASSHELVSESTTSPSANRLSPEGNVTQTAQLLAASEFDLADFFGVTSPLVDAGNQHGVEVTPDKIASPKSGDEIAAITPDELLTQPQKLAQVWRVMADETQAGFVGKIRADTFAVGESMASQTLGWLQNIVGACGPLCSHGLISALSANGSSVTRGLGSGLFGSGNGLDSSTGTGVGSLPPFDWKMAATELEKNGAFWYGDQKISWSDLVTIWSKVLGESLGQLFGFGIIDCLLDGLLPGQQKQFA